jgi:glycosyltransferase involved in cell wall biosynthesis
MEEAYITACLSSALKFILPEGVNIEVLVMEGRSGDRTLELVREFACFHSCVRLIDNPGRIQSTAVNLGVQSSGGDWIMRLDAHAVYPSDYLQLCYETALRSGADNVGGVFITEPGGQGYSAKLVQALTTHKFGVGDSGFRTGDKEGWADTVPYGFYRREVFDKIGLLDERLVRAQDYEFNRRLIASGGRILRNPNIQIHYFNQPSLSAFYRKQFFLEAPYNAYMWYLAPYAFTWRHAVTGIFTFGFLGGIMLGPFYPRLIGIPFVAVMALYTVLGVFAGIQQAIRYKEKWHIFALPFAFFIYHFIHGLGLLRGIFRLATFTAPVQKINVPWPGAGFFRMPVDHFRKAFVGIKEGGPNESK